MSALQKLVDRCNELDITEQLNIFGDASIQFEAKKELDALQARVEELEKEKARMNFRLGWIYDNFGDTTATRFALEAEDSEIDEKMERGEK